MSSRRGLTLIELMVALFILSLVIGATFAVYISNLKIYKSEAKTAETQMSKVLALELLRRDIVHAGAGLPWDLDVDDDGTNDLDYGEAVEADADDYNDTTDPDPDGNVDEPPRPFVLGDDVSLLGGDRADYLVIKGALAADNGTTRKWGILSHTGGGWQLQNMGEGEDLGEDDWAIIISTVGRELHMSGGNWYWKGNAITGVGGLDSSVVYLVQGIRHEGDSGDKPRMPFNRVDYYLRRPNALPDRCNPNTYILYRATIIHETHTGTNKGERAEEPILDCVKDFQVAFGIDTDGDGDIDSWSSAPPNTPEDVREQIKEVRVLILYQEGQRLEHEASTTSITLGDSQTGILSTFAPTGEDRHYRWKVLKLAVRPLNLGT